MRPRHPLEEIDVASKGANFGWPCFEAAARSKGYKRTALCQSLYRRPAGTTRLPAIGLSHQLSASITGGAFVPQSFPPRYRAAYLFGDWGFGWMRYVEAEGRSRFAPIPGVRNETARDPLRFTSVPTAGSTTSLTPVTCVESIHRDLPRVGVGRSVRARAGAATG